MKELGAYNKYLAMDVSSNNVKYVNYIVLSSCIGQIAYGEPSVSALVSDTPSIEEWRNMFASVGLSW
jgi:hypothetical protein